MRIRKLLLGGVIAIGAAFVLVQFVPYGRDHTNPPAVAEPAWNHPATRDLAMRACFDCHSNQTKWPWYSHVAPLSWLVQSHVDEGREALNFSAGPAGLDEADEAAEAVLDGAMPPRSYTLLHPEARLSAAERDALAAGLAATFRGGDGGDHDDHDD